MVKFLGAERRRFWHDDEKLEIVASVGVAGALFLPLDMPVTAGVAVAQAPVAETPPSVAVELRLRGGRSLHFESAIDPAALSALIRVVDAG